MLTERAEASSQSDRARRSATEEITETEAEHSAASQQIAQASIYYYGELNAIDMPMDNQVPVRGGEACAHSTGASLRWPGDRQSVSQCAARPSVVETSLAADTYPQRTSQRKRCAK
jgi:hypothetical protein